MPAVVSDTESDKNIDSSSNNSMAEVITPKGNVIKRMKSRVPVSDVQDEPLLKQAKDLMKKQKAEFKEETQGYGWYEWIAYFIPCLLWLRTYRVKDWLLADIVAGLSVGAMVIPQGMSYAKLAGLPLEYGLYGAFVPCLIYAMLGSSRHLAVGPVAVTSILLGNGLSDFLTVPEQPTEPKAPSANATTEDMVIYNATMEVYNNNLTAYNEASTTYNHAAIQVAFIAGVMYTCVGLLRLGWLTYFLSHATISGFMSGAAIIIALSQVKYIFGLYDMGRSETLQGYIEQIIEYIDEFKWREFIMSMSFIGILILFRFLSRRYKKLQFLRALGPLTVCVLSIAIMNIWDLYEPMPGQEDVKKPLPYIKPVGKIPSGMPEVTVSWWFPLENVGKQIVLSLVICMIDVCESMSIAKALAQKNKYKLNATQELRGLGIANLIGAMFNCYTTTGSFSRSAVNEATGAHTGLSGFVTGILVMFTLLFLTPIFTNMSANVQGAIIIHGVLGLFQYEEFIYLWKVSKFDWFIWVCTFLCTLFAGVEIGIFVGIGVSIVVVIYKTAFPRITDIGQLPGTSIYRNIAMYPDAVEPKGMVLLRIDAPIFFANIEGIRDYVLDRLDKAKIEHERSGDPVRFVIIDCSPVADIDIAGIHFLHDLIADLKKDGIQLILANPAKEVVLMLKRAKLVQEIGEGGIQVSVGDAVRYAEGALEEDLRQQGVETA